MALSNTSVLVTFSEPVSASALNASYYAITQQDEQHRPDNFREKWMHGICATRLGAS